MLTVVLLPCTEEKMNKLIESAVRTLSDGECDCDCKNCAAAFSCQGPDYTPFSLLKDFLKHNKKLDINDDKYTKLADR